MQYCCSRSCVLQTFCPFLQNRLYIPAPHYIATTRGGYAYYKNSVAA